MRIRNIKPEFWRSDDIARLPKVTRLTFIGLWSYVDDNGVGLDKPVNIAADLYANELAEDPTATLLQVTDDLAALHAGGQILRYTAAGKKLLYVVTWSKHQYIPKPSKGHQYPLPSAETVGLHVTHMRPTCNSPESVQVGTGGQGDRGTGGLGDRGTGGQGTNLAVPAPEPKSQRGKRLPENWKPPDEKIREIRDRFPALDVRSEHEKFCNHWWSKAGQNATKIDWVRTWVNWMITAAERLPSKNGSTPPQSAADRKAEYFQSLKTPGQGELQ